MAAETALLALEGGLTLTIGRGSVPAPRTRLACVGRVYEVDRDTGPCSLVGEKRSQLVEGPGVPLIAVLAANRELALANAGQVFEGQCLARYGGFLHQGL